MMHTYWQQFAHLDKAEVSKKKEKAEVLARSHEFHRTDAQISPEGCDALQSADNSLTGCKWTSNLTSFFQEQKP